MFDIPSKYHALGNRVGTDGARVNCESEQGLVVVVDLSNSMLIARPSPMVAALLVKRAPSDRADNSFSSDSTFCSSPGPTFYAFLGFAVVDVTLNSRRAANRLPLLACAQ